MIIVEGKQTEKNIARLQLKTIIDLTRKGYKVYQNVNVPKSDLIALKDNRLFRVEIASGNVREMDMMMGLVTPKVKKAK
jgi:hypothetical protein